MRDTLNDPLTHVERCGPVLRSAANEQLSALAELLPQDFLGVPVEYDLTYESPANTIRGYKYTDLLTSCIWLAPCNTALSTRTITEVLARGPTNVGRAVVKAVTGSLQDKYRLLPAKHTPEVLVIMPGSNVLQHDVVDWTIVDKAVADGAWIKPHPITLKLDVLDMERRYPGRVIHKDAALYGMLATCRKVYFPANSETGLVAGLLGKDATLINKTTVNAGATFAALYQSLDQCRLNAPRIEKIAALFSHPETGMFSVHHMPLIDMEQWLNRFFLAYQDYPHGRGKERVTARALLAGAA